jgi:hypothetical protein
MKAFYEYRQVPGAAADLEDPLVWLDAGLIDQPSVDRPQAQQSLKRVIKWEQPIMSHCR